jgi:hypothetical protein
MLRYLGGFLPKEFEKKIVQEKKKKVLAANAQHQCQPP